MRNRGEWGDSLKFPVVFLIMQGVLTVYIAKRFPHRFFVIIISQLETCNHFIEKNLSNDGVIIFRIRARGISRFLD